MRADSNGRDESPAELIAGYTPKQRETYLRGLRILAKVTVRAHMRRKAAEFETAQDGGGEERFMDSIRSCTTRTEAKRPTGLNSK